MARLLFVLGIVAVTFMIYSIVDAALRPVRLIRGLPKWAWLLVIIVIPIIGGVLWFVIGRGREQKAAVYRTVGPDDDPDFLGKLGYTTPRDPTAEARLSDVVLPPDARILVLVVGPEGGIAPHELDLFEREGAVRVRLGDEILRTSTAGPSALAVLNVRLKRW